MPFDIGKHVQPATKKETLTDSIIGQEYWEESANGGVSSLFLYRAGEKAFGQDRIPMFTVRTYLRLLLAIYNLQNCKIALRESESDDPEGVC